MSLSKFSQRLKHVIRYKLISYRQLTIAIRRETKSLWERRAPINPRDTKLLVERGVNVVIQPSSRRVYSNREYEEAGARLSENISEADVILGKLCHCNFL